jgi:hypothetical protein
MAEVSKGKRIGNLAESTPSTSSHGCEAMNWMIADAKTEINGEFVG